jgi:hypothetical protein
VTAAALLASLFVGLSTAGAETVPTAVQFNMHGANGSASGHNTNVGQWTLSALRNTDPSSSSQSVWTASLNEACWSQWVFLWNNYFGIKGFQGQAYWARWTNPGCGNFGNTATVRGTARGPNPDRAQPFPTQGQSAPAELKGYVCLQSNFYGQWSCSAHLQSSNVPVANTQLWQFDVAINDIAVAQTPLLLGGDYNMAPYQSGATQVRGWNYQVAVEADASAYWNPFPSNISGKRSTTDGGVPIDYIFRRPGTRSSTARISLSPYSDHHFYVMRL